MNQWIKVAFRLVVAVVVPPVLGLLMTMVQIADYDQSVSALIADVADELPFLITAAFAFTLVPSLIMFALFEFLLSKKLKSVKGYVFSGALYGFGSGLFILYAINHQIWLLHSVNLIGVVVGALVGAIFHSLYKARPT